MCADPSATACEGAHSGALAGPDQISPTCAAQLKLLGYSNGVPPTFGSDWLWSYELGAKNRLLDGRLQVDASVFHIDWSNVQQPIQVPACAASFTSNLGAAVSNGFDLGVTALVGDSIKLGLAMSYTDAKFTKTIYVATDLGGPVDAAAGGVTTKMQNPGSILSFTYKP